MKLFILFSATAFLAAGPALADPMVSVLQKDMTFSKPVISIPVGTTVMWGNADDVSHNITVSGNGADVDHGLQKPHEIIRQSFSAAGSYRVICHIHPKMKMTVVVE